MNDYKLIEAPLRVWRLHKRFTSPVSPLPTGLSERAPQILLVADSPETAIAESLAPFRAAPDLARHLESINRDPKLIKEVGQEWQDRPALQPNLIPHSWAEERLLSQITLPHNLSLIDADSNTLSRLPAGPSGRRPTGSKAIIAVLESGVAPDVAGVRIQSKIRQQGYTFGLLLNQISVPLEAESAPVQSTVYLHPVLQALGLALAN